MTVRVQKVNFVYPTHEGDFKSVRNIESGVPKVKILENLIRTLIRTELIKIGAYDRWNPYINHYQSDFLGLVAILDLFTSDAKLIARLRRFHRMRKKLARKDEGVDLNKYLSENYSLRQTLAEKIKSTAVPSQLGFRIVALK
jgi:hypothetical protein